MFHQLEQQLLQKDHQQASVVDQTRDRLGVLQREITYREAEIQGLRQQIHGKEMQADAALVSDKLNRNNIGKLQHKNDAKD
jgi:hypothetical protein